jgi:hypothetical protein
MEIGIPRAFGHGALEHRERPEPIPLIVVLQGEAKASMVVVSGGQVSQAMRSKGQARLIGQEVGKRDPQGGETLEI